jgi:hypothetical protein
LELDFPPTVKSRVPRSLRREGSCRSGRGSTGSRGRAAASRLSATGAILSGRGSYDVGEGSTRSETSRPFGGRWSGPEFVLTHRPPADPPPGLRFLSGDIREAVDTARAAAGGRNLLLLGANVTQQAWTPISLTRSFSSNCLFCWATASASSGVPATERCSSRPSWRPAMARRSLCTSGAGAPSPLGYSPGGSFEKAAFATVDVKALAVVPGPVNPYTLRKYGAPWRSRASTAA